MATRPLSNFLLVAAVSVLWLAAVPSWGRTLSQGGEEAARREEREDYFRRWLREDVVHIITDEEEGVFQRLTTPEEKDALLRTPGAGLTLAEELGLTTKAQRPFFSPGNRENYPRMTRRAKDSPFAHYETYARIQARRARIRPK
ncbi:MAG: hypothetical protein OXT71_09505 [Acidobacteriota bacterium]|nr:hypothetical protein [Acidobacteriota bacterium]MDE2926621.1 hypothetical protein [Acidobacteriota bacterium]